MACPDCGGETVAFAVSDSLREHAPDGSAHAALCSVCLRVHPEDGSAASDFSAVIDGFPDGEGGVALALLLGKLDSLALNRAEIEALVERAERAGVDVLLALDRLAVAGTVEPHFDIDRRRPQLEQILD